MIYVRAIHIKREYIYYKLVVCECDGNGSPKQEFIKYLRKKEPTTSEITKVLRYNDNVKDNLQVIHYIVNSLMRGQSGLLNKEKFLEKCLANGIREKTVNEYLELYLKKDKYIQIPKNKKGDTNISKKMHKIIDHQSERLNFNRKSMEKVVRLSLILKEISKNNLLKEKLAFFGGTAINMIYNNLLRLSVDIDLQYIGSKDKDQMLKDRDKIRETFKSILENLKYKYKFVSNYALDQYNINYEMRDGHVEKIKVDLNYYDRVPILPLEPKKVKTPLHDQNFSLKTFKKEELYARKIIALIERGASRDIFDMANVKFRNYSPFRKCIITNLLLRKMPVVDSLNKKINKPTLREFGINIQEVAKISDKQDIEELYQKVLVLLSKVTNSITDREKIFIEGFNPNDPKFHLLFGSIRINQDINKSPLLLYRFRK